MTMQKPETQRRLSDPLGQCLALCEMWSDLSRGRCYHG